MTLKQDLQDAVKLMEVEVQKLEGYANVSLTSIKEAFANLKQHVESAAKEVEHEGETVLHDIEQVVGGGSSTPTEEPDVSKVVL